jgi:hypothetical protein
MQSEMKKPQTLLLLLLALIPTGAFGADDVVQFEPSGLVDTTPAWNDTLTAQFLENSRTRKLQAASEVELVEAPGSQLLDTAYWEQQCSRIPAGATYVKVVMGDIVDYFRPITGATFCQMLTSVATAAASKHQWSADGQTWVTPSYGSFNWITGGSAHNWPRDNNPGDNRYYLSFWGAAFCPNCQGNYAGNEQMWHGGCCSTDYSERFTHFKKSFTMYVGGGVTLTGGASTPPRELPCYVETFQKTGCRRTQMWQNSWWDSQPDAVVGSDMYAYCTLVSAGTASSWQKSFCCDGAEGEAASKECGAGMTCTKQAELSCPNPPSPERQQDNYLHGCMAGAFLASGCAREVLPSGDENWWVPRLEAGQNYSVFNDMYNYCLAQRNGPTTEQRDTCCKGNHGTRAGAGCGGSLCQKLSGSWEQYCPQPHQSDLANLKVTFQATGCPNDYELEVEAGQGWDYLGNQYAPLWGYMTEEKVLDDMYSTCQAVKAGYSTNQQRSWCCGPNDWTGGCGANITACTKQTALLPARRRMLETEEAATKAVYV